MLSKSLAVDLAADNIRVNAIWHHRDAAVSKFVRNRARSEAAFRVISDRYLIKRPERPAEAASTALFLMSAEAGYCSAVAVDGGRRFH